MRRPTITLRALVPVAVAFAPASQLAAQGKLIPNLGNIKSLSGLISLIVRGIDVQKPSLHVASYLTPRASALYPQTLAKCLPDLGKANSFGGLAANEIFRTDQDLAPVLAQLGRNDPEDLKIPTPVRVEQGASDKTVSPGFMEDLVKLYTARTIKVTYMKYPGFTHGDVITKDASQTDATNYIRAHFKG